MAGRAFRPNRNKVRGISPGLKHARPATLTKEQKLKQVTRDLEAKGFVLISEDALRILIGPDREED